MEAKTEKNSKRSKRLGVFGATEIKRFKKRPWV